MFKTVPTENIIAMCVTLILSVALFVAALIFFRKKTKGEFMPVLFGAITFIGFALMLESVLNNVVALIVGKEFFTGMWFYAIYGGLAAGIFEETGRLIIMKLLMKKNLRKENALMFGVGHGGAEILLLIGMTYVSNIAVSVMLNSGIFEQSLEGMDEAMIAQTAEQLSALWTTPAYMFLLSFIERIFAFALQICLSYFVYRAVKYKKPMMYVLALLIHFAADAGLVLLSRTVSLYITEIVLAAGVITLSVVTFMVYRAEKPEPLPETENVPVQQSEESGAEAGTSE